MPAAAVGKRCSGEVIFPARRHPQTVGEFERVNRTPKQKLQVAGWHSLEELAQAVAEFRHWYSYERAGQHHSVNPAMFLVDTGARGAGLHTLSPGVANLADLTRCDRPGRSVLPGVVGPRL